ncbi:hypothetical protein ABXJ76_08385 [Methylobacter sp. G7]|uniref:hypothetical protein n=1 Tax=Methylobacter sp. G7 TaxID=3230117 RepID=UPI003D808E29
MGLFSSLFGSKKSESNSSASVGVDDLLNALDNYINDYEETNGRKPETILLDFNIHIMFAQAGVYKTNRFNGIRIEPIAGIDDGLTWKAV